MNNMTNIEETLDAIETLLTCKYRTETLEWIVEDLREIHFARLLKHPRFRDKLKADNEMMLKHQDRLSSPKLKRRLLFKCSKFKIQAVIDASATKFSCSGSPMATCGQVFA